MIFLPKKISRVFLQVFFTVFISYFCLVNFNLKVSASEEIFISEVSFSGSVALNNCQLESGFVANLCNFDKWVELYNPSQNAINLDGWRIRVQGGLTQKLSGQIPAESFLVLSNNSYNYQAREKVVETFVPAESQSTQSSAQSSQNSSNPHVNSESNSQNNSQDSSTNSSQNSQVQNSQNDFSSQPSSTNSSQASQVSSQQNSQVNSQQTNSQSFDNFSSDFNQANSATSSISFSAANSSQASTTNSVVNSTNTNQVLNFQSPKIIQNPTVELKSAEIKPKTLNFENSLENNPSPLVENTSPTAQINQSSNSQIYLQINKNNLTDTQKKFISTNFKGAFSTQNAKFETLNSSINNQQKQALFDQKISWNLQKQTTIPLYSTLTQGGFGSVSLGILHSISPTNPNVALINPQGQTISQRIFGNVVSLGQNRYSVEFDEANSSGSVAVNSYFYNNFGTPGTGQIKKKLPITAATTISNLPNPIQNPQEKPQENLQSENSQKIAENVEQKQNSQVQNEKQTLTNVQSPVSISNPISNPIPSLNPSFSPVLQTQNQTVQAKNQVKTVQENSESVKNPATESSQIVQKSLEKSVENSTFESKKIPENLNQIWHQHLPENYQKNFENTKISPAVSKNEPISDNLTSSNENQVENVQNLKKSLKTSQNILFANSNIQLKSSQDILGLETNSFLNFWVNLLLLVLMLKKNNLEEESSEKLLEKSQSFPSKLFSKILLNLAIRKPVLVKVTTS